MPLLHWADANWDFWLTASVLPRVLFVSEVVFAFPKAASLEQHVGLGLVSWQTGDTVFSEAALCCAFHPTHHAFLDVFIVPQIC